MTTANSQKRKKILFVDDDQAFLETIEQLFAMWGNNSWDIFLAHNTGKALAILQQQPVDLVVIDMRMPVVDGMQLLRLLNRKYPHLAKAMLTGSADDATRADCLQNGAELYLEKPTSVQGMENVFSTLDELTNLRPQEGFRGVLRRVGLQEVLQLECLGRKSSVLEVTGAGRRGKIFIREGDIIHAQIGEIKGEPAFNRLMSIEGGDFALKPFNEPPEQTINSQWEMLIMEAARVKDEVPESLEDSAAETAAQESAAELAATPEAMARSRPASVPAGGPVKPAGKILMPSLLEPHTEEVLICSLKGDVLYEWQCPEAEGRIKLTDFLNKKAAELTASLPLGKLERVEAALSPGRMVIKFQGDTALLVRSDKGASEAAPLAKAA